MMHGHHDYASMHRITLWGKLRKQFLPEYTLRVATVQEATRALSQMVQGFGATVAKGHFRIVLGDRRTGRVLSEQEVGTVLPVGVDIHIMPVVAGSGRNGGAIGKIVSGIVLVVASFIPGVNMAVWGAYASQAMAFELAAGMALAMSGITMLLSPQARAAQAQQQQNSFAFSGVQNNTQQGVAVPVVYGQFMTGSVAVSQGISTRQLMN